MPLLGTGTTIAPLPPAPSDSLLLPPILVRTMAVELAMGALSGTIARGAAVVLADSSAYSSTGTTRPPSTPPTSETQDVADALRNPVSALAGSGGSHPHPRSRRAGGGRVAHAGASRVPLRGRSGDTLVRPLDFWVGQDVDAAECVCWCQTRSAEHGVHPHPTRVVRLVQDGQHSQLRSVSEQAAPGASTLPGFRRAAQVKASALPCVQAPRL